MNIHYDPKEDVMYIRLSEMPYAESEEVRDGVIFDKDESGAIAGIELLNVSQQIPQLNTKDFNYEIAGVKKWLSFWAPSVKLRGSHAPLRSRNPRQKRIIMAFLAIYVDFYID